MLVPLKEALRSIDYVTLAQLIFVILMLSSFLIIPILQIMAKTSLEWLYDMASSEYFRFPPSGQAIQFIETLGGSRILYIQGSDFGIILNSLIVAVIVMIFTTLIGMALAFIMARYDFPGKNLFRILVLIPMLPTPFVNAFVIKQWITSQKSFLNILLRDVLHIIDYSIIIDGLAAVALVQTLSFFPIVYLNIFSALINIDPSLEEQAENMGAHGLKLFRTVTLPLSLPGIASGAILVFIFSLEDLGAPIVFSSHELARRLMSYQIYKHFFATVTGEVDPKAVALSLVLLVIALICFMIIKGYVSLRGYAMLSKGGRWNPRVSPLRKKWAPLVYIFIIGILSIAALPQMGVLFFSFAEKFDPKSPFPTSYTLMNFQKLLFDPLTSRVILNSLTYSLLAVTLIVLMGFSSSYIVERRKAGHFSNVLDALVTMPIAIPGIVVAVGYLALFSNPMFASTPLDPFLSPWLLIALAYSVRRLPFAARTIYAGLQQIHVNLEEAAYTVGAGRLRTLFQIVASLIAANMFSGAMLAFVYCMSEVSVSVTLGGLGAATQSQPITYHIQNLLQWGTGAISIASALGSFLMSLQIISFIITIKLLKQRIAFLGV